MPLTQLVMSPLSRHDAFYLITAFGVISHLMFNKLEPRTPAALFSLLIVLPGALSTILLPHFNHRIFAIVATFSTYYLVLSLSVVVYRLSPFHPLARYPGPIFGKISMFWAVWVNTAGKQHIYYQNIHRKYGDVVRIGPNELYIRDPSVIDLLYGVNGLPKEYSGRTANARTPSIMSIRDRNEHMQRRTHWLRGLNAAAIRDYEPTISKRVKQLVELLENSGGSSVDLSQLLGHFTYDFMSDMVFGGMTEMLRDGDVDKLWKLQNEGIISATIFGRIPWIGPFAHLLTYFTGKLLKHRKYGMQTAEKRKREGSQTKDLFYHLIDEGGVGKVPPSLEQVVSDGTLAIIAGSDTTSLVLSNLFFFLMSNRQAFLFLRAEVDKFYPADEDGSSAKFHGDMPYLAACINESLRLFPAVPAGSQRGCYKGMGSRMIGLYYIPEGTALAVNTYSIHRDSRNFFPNVDMFWPERWLIAEKKEYVAFPPSLSLPSPPSVQITQPEIFTHNMDAFIPFSYGPANCVGKFLALQEMKTLVCYTLQKLDLRFADGYRAEQWLDDLEGYTLFLRGALPVVVTRRG